MLADHTEHARYLLAQGWRLTDRGWVSPWAAPGDIIYGDVIGALRAHEAWTAYMVECATGAGYVRGLAI